MAPKFVRAHVRAMDGYTPGEQPRVGERVIKLNTNENPFPPSPKVLAAIRDVDAETLRRYPNPTAQRFREAAAKVLGVSSDMILAGNGSDDVLTIATRVFVGAGGTLATPEITYSLYPVLAEIEQAKHVKVPWGEDWTLPIEALLETKADAIYLANPNAPTGTTVHVDDMRKLADAFNGALLVDEAYADFAEGNCLSLARDCANVVITRSMSKAYSLAGLRFGFAVAQAEVINEMMKVKDSYNVDAISMLAATAAIEDQEYAVMTWQNIREERTRMTNELELLGWNVLPSQTNFVLAAVPDGRGREMYLGLREQGIIVRHFNLPGLSDKLRITIGTGAENNALLGGIKTLMTTEKAA